MLLRTTLFAVVLTLILAACVIGDEEDPATATPAPTAPITGADTTPTPAETGTAATATPVPAEPSATPANPTETTTGDASPTPTTGSVSESTATVTPLPAAPTETPVPTATTAPQPLPLDQLSVGLELVTGGLVEPAGIANAGDGSNRIFVLEQPGRVRIVDADGTLVETPFLDITDRVGSNSTEQGLLGLAFHPDYANNGRFFINYTNRDGNTVISEFAVTGEPNIADPASETLILFVEQPAGNHNGGHLVFGPDGYLWIGLGDGGAAGDQFQNAQNPGTLLGSMLRIDIDGAEPYGVPASNPYIDNPNARNEAWAIGLRNPWRYSFDRLTGDLYIADVGQGQREEVSFAPASSAGGENYGWPIIEGSICYPSDPCNADGLVLPIAEYDHSGGNCAITGGYVYRGSQQPGLWGTYVYADYCSGRFWGLRQTDAGTESQLFFQRAGALFSSFGEDEQGEIYVVSLESSSLYRVVAF